MAEDKEIVLRKAELQAQENKTRIIAGAVVSVAIVTGLTLCVIASIQNQTGQETNPENAE